MKLNLSNNYLVISLTNIFVFLTLIVFFYLWDFDFGKINPFSILLIPLILKCFFLKKDQFNYKTILFLFLFLVFIFIFFLIPYNFNFEILPLNKLIKIIGLFSLILFCLVFKDKIISQIKYIVICFCIIYIFLNFYPKYKSW